MKTYSVELRGRVVEAVGRGVARAEVASTFGVSLSTVKRLLARRRRDAEDDLAPKRRPGRRAAIAAPEQREALRAQLEGNRTATVAEHARLWNEANGATLSQWAVGRAIRKLGWARKKGRWGPPSGTR